ncbi:MAG: DUF3299 domain-containing protein [Gemmatimonadetes bacterium]|nr:DUF3299 domain-containing protein [Gemmatimonadota bacterium]
MIDASPKFLFAIAATLLVITLSVSVDLSEAVPEPPVDAQPDESANKPISVGWRVLASLNYRTGKPSAELAALDGKFVKVPGFTVTLEDWASSAKEFLLVPYVGACIHTPPPPPNQLVYIEMVKGKWAFLDGWNPVWVEGVLKIEMTKSVYGPVGFTITGQRVYPYEY